MASCSLIFLAALFACGDDLDFEQGVDGTIVLSTDRCSNPDTVDIYAASAEGSPCSWIPEFDTGWSDTGHWTDNVAELVASPDASDGAFAAELDVGDYEARVFGDCYGCVDFSVSAGALTEVELTLRETVYADAPNIYLYPETATGVSVRLAQARHIVAAEPDYPAGGWQALAQPDGSLITDDGVFDYLFYELRTPAGRLQHDAGWCVPGHLAQSSIEEAMALSGFLHDEIVDFSDFWDAHWPAAEWMTVYPQTQHLGALRISPAPDQLLRMWFVVEDGCWPVDEPELPQVDRRGFHAAEWGIVFDRAYPRDWDWVR